MSTNACPCGSGRPFDHCCKPLLSRATTAATAEDLMRSRYTAFVVNDAAYLAHTWHSTTRPTEVTAPSGIAWRRLRIRDTHLGGPDDATGEVEFVAHYRSVDGTRDFLHERSRFAREKGRWMYVDGELF